MSQELYQRIYTTLTAIEEAMINNSDYSNLLANLRIGTEQYCINNSVNWSFLTDTSLSPEETQKLLNAAIAKAEKKLKAAIAASDAQEDLSNYR